MITFALQWRHNDHDIVSNHQPHGCLFNRFFRHRSKKTSKFRVTGLCVGNSPGPVNSPHKGPVTRRMFPFHDVIVVNVWLQLYKYTTVASLANHITNWTQRPVKINVSWCHDMASQTFYILWFINGLLLCGTKTESVLTSLNDILKNS